MVSLCPRQQPAFHPSPTLKTPATPTSLKRPTLLLTPTARSALKPASNDRRYFLRPTPSLTFRPSPTLKTPATPTSVVTSYTSVQEEPKTASNDRRYFLRLRPRKRRDSLKQAPLLLTPHPQPDLSTIDPWPRSRRKESP